MKKTHEYSIASSTYTLWCICTSLRLQGPCFLCKANLVMESLCVLGRFLVHETFAAMVTDTRGCGRLEFAFWAANEHFRWTRAKTDAMRRSRLSRSRAAGLYSEPCVILPVRALQVLPSVIDTLTMNYRQFRTRVLPFPNHICVQGQAFIGFGITAVCMYKFNWYPCAANII